jgi:hypothetical protein
MARDFLAFLGLLFLVLLIAIALSVVGYYYDALGLVDLPPVIPTTLARVLGPRTATVTVEVEAISIGTAEWRNPLADLPTATWSPTETPQPTPTTVQPLSLAEYRTEVILNLKDLTGALEAWLDANRQLAKDNGLLDDAAWRADMQARLEQIRASAQAMADVGPAPEEYQGIARLLRRVGEAAEALSTDYGQAMDTRAAEDFRQAGADFEKLKAYLEEAVKAMLDADWVIE